ncbi:MAG: ATP-binding protein, partial [Comamonas sp.]|nr:ATP-binding protein [Comamonas sp.]
SLRIRAELVDDDELRQAMVNTINEMHSMVEEILHFAQDDAMRETTQLVDLDALVGEVVEQQRTLGRQVDWSPPDSISYRCRPAHLKRALANLIDNAARYGRVQVRLTVPDAADPGTAATVRMEIEDEGPGIAPQDMEQAFQPFSRLEVARNGETGGFGLGLAIARSCVRAHGGELKLHNRSEGGLRAVIELPA